MLLTKVNRAENYVRFSHHMIGVDAPYIQNPNHPSHPVASKLIYLRDKRLDVGREMASDRASLTGLAE